MKKGMKMGHMTLLTSVLVALTQLAKTLKQMPIGKLVLMLAMLMSTFGTILGGLYILQA